MCKPLFKLIYLDDEPDVVEDLSAVLDDLGFSVSATSSNEEAINWALSGSFDAVLLDCCMPPSEDMKPFERVAFGRETGIEITRRIRHDNEVIPIAMLTVVTDNGMVAKMKDAGVELIINKPADPQRIADSLTTLLKNRIK